MKKHRICSLVLAVILVLISIPISPYDTKLLESSEIKNVSTVTNQNSVTLNAASEKIKTKKYTISKKAGTYSSRIKVNLKAKKGYKVYYSINNKFKPKKVVKSGKKAKIIISKTKTLCVYAVKSTKKITAKQLKTKAPKKSKKYTYIIQKQINEKPLPNIAPPNNNSGTTEANKLATYMVTFETNGGNSIAPQIIQEGMSVTEPVRPTKEGYIFEGWYIDETLSSSYDFTATVNKSITLYAKWKKQPEEESDMVLKIDTNNFAYSDEDGCYVIADVVNEISGNLKASGMKDYLSLSIKDSKGNLLFNDQISAGNTWTFSNIGFIVGKNIVTVTTNVNDMKLTDEITILNLDEDNTKNLMIDTSDTDQDGLNNYLEKFYGTDINKADTDSDGLNDYYELYISNTFPIEFDTDGNGVSDSGEDFDQDGVINLVEFQKSGNLFLDDTDGDELNDAEEIKYGTALNLSDTDSDGISDYWEVAILYTNPLEDEGEGSREFTYSKTYDSNTTVQPIVEITAPGNILQTLEIEPIDTKNGLLTSSLPGFIGQGYDISLDGDFSSATVRFKIDDVLFDSSNFSPALYYYNEDEQRLEKVENQRLEDHQVVAELEHFSSYIVLNEEKYTDVMEKAGKYNDIPKTDSDGDGLPDFLENNGIIMQNGLYFYTFSNNPDSDGDGLKDGEEIAIQELGDGSWYGIMYSNPNQEDSDRDGADDFVERERNSSAMHCDMLTDDMEMLLNNEQYTSTDFRNDFDDDTFPLQRYLFYVDSALVKNWNYSLLYKEILLDFFEAHNEDLYNIKLQGIYNKIIDSAVNWMATVNSTTAVTNPETISAVEENLRKAKQIQIQVENNQTSAENMADVMELCGDIYEKLGNDAPKDFPLNIDGNGIKSLLSFSGNAFKSIAKANEVVKIYAEIDANAELLQEHADILRYICGYSNDANLQSAAAEILTQVNMEGSSIFETRDTVYAITSELLIDAVFNKLSPIEGTASQVLDSIDAATDWSEIPAEINKRGVNVLGYAGVANALSDGMQNDGLSISSTEYTSVTNNAVYNLYILLFLRKEAENAWNDALPYRSTSKSMKERCEENIKLLNGIEDRYHSGQYRFVYGNYSAFPRQGICGYVSSPNNADINIYAYENGKKNACAIDFTRNGKFFLSLDNGTYDIQVTSAMYKDYWIEDVAVENNATSIEPFLMELNDAEEVAYETFDLYAEGADDKFQAVIINNYILTILGYTDSQNYSQYGITDNDMENYFFTPLDTSTGYFGMLNPSEEAWNYLDLSYCPDGEYIFYFACYKDRYMYKYSGRPMVIEVTNGQAAFVKTNSLSYNQKMLEDLNKCNPEDFLIPEEHESVTEEDMENIRTKAEEITAGISDDYHKAKAIYEWVCANITYDSSTSGNSQNQLPQTVLETKKAMCDGYAQITQALLISIDIPCAFIVGYSPGNSADYLSDDSSLFNSYSNHAWNAAYIDERWVLIEPTWGNQVTNNHMLLGDFDTHLDAFTMLHRYEQIGRITIEQK